MPMKKDPEKGGTEINGRKSLRYCSFCYEEGVFKQANWTAKEMQTFVKGKLKEMGFPGLLARLFSRNIPKLERWKGLQE